MTIDIKSSHIQKLFLKLCFIFRQVNLEVYLPPNSSETVQLLAPKEIWPIKEQVGAIQYGGIKYPLKANSQLNLEYVEVRLKGDFLRQCGVYNNIYELFKQSDANDWLKYKFNYSKEELNMARKAVKLIEKGFVTKFGNRYLTIGMDKALLEIPRQPTKNPGTYTHSKAVTVISDLLINQGYTIARTSKNQPTYHLTATSKTNGRSARILIRHLEHDSAYKDSTIPYQVYKLDAFETSEQQKQGIKEIEFVVGYNFKDNCYVCLDINQFLNKRSRVVHEREGQNADYYNSWDLLNRYLS